MSDDARSALAPKGPRRIQRPRILVVNNPGPDSDEEDNQIPTNDYPPYAYQPQDHPSSSQSLLLDGRSVTTNSHIPAPLTTDLPEHRPCYPSSRSNPSNPALSSPSSTSSPAFESTPPPSTPGQSLTPVELTGESTLRPDNIILPQHERPEPTNFRDLPPRPTNQGLFDRLRNPLSRSANTSQSSTRPATSPTTSIPDSYVSPTTNGLRGSPSERVTFLVTADAETLNIVDITGARDAAFIKEKIFTKLQISDEDQPFFNIYRTEIGAYATSEALTDDQLLELYRTGDAKGTIKLLASHSHMPVHKHSSESLASPTVTTTIPPPVMPQHAIFAPLRPRKRSKSRRGSMSSASERVPQELANGYEASVSDDLDQADRDSRRSTIRPPNSQHALTLPIAPRSRSPGGYNRPPTPPNILSPERTQVLSPDSQTLRPDRPLGNSLPTPPMTTSSPQAMRFNDESSYQSPPQWHGRSGSDAAIDRERSLQGSEGVNEIVDRSYRHPDVRVRDDRTRRKDSHQRKDTGLRRANAKAAHEPHDRRGEPWTVVPSGIPTSSYRKDRPTTPQDPPRPSGSGSPRFPQAAGYNIPQQPRAPPPPVPSSESRSHGKHRNGRAVPAGWSIAYRGPQKTEKPLQSPPTPPWSKMVAKSLNDLRGSYKQQSGIPPSLQPGKARGPPPQLPAVPPVPSMSRPGTSGSMQSTNGITPTNSMSGDTISPSSHTEPPMYQELGVPKSFDGARGGPHSPVTAYHPARLANTSGYSAGPFFGSSYLGLTSPGQEPYPRPRSALGTDPTTSPYRPPRQLQSPRTSEFSQEVAATHHTSPAPSPHFPSAGLSAPSSGTLYDETSPATYGPRPSHAVHPRSDSLSSSDYSVHNGPSQVPRSPVAARNIVPEPGADRRTAEPAQQMKRTLSSLPVRESEDDGESTVRRDELAHYMDMLERETSGSGGTIIASKPRSPTPPRMAPSAMANPETPPSRKTQRVSFAPCDDDSEDDDDDFWVKAPKKPQPADSAEVPWQTASALQARNGSRPILAPISTDSSPVARPVGLPSTSYHDQPSRAPSSNSVSPPANYAPAPPPRQRRTTGPPPTNSQRRLHDQRTSRFDDNFDLTWAPRPPPEEVLDNLQEYFPQHDVDKPVIEAQSGGTSPTSVDHPPLPTPTDKRFRHKKSIRYVAAEAKRRGDRLSHVERTAPTGQGAQLRKRNTKVWGSKTQEVTSISEANDLSAEASPGGGAKPIFRWVRGEMIGKGTYGKVYLALNATTGEMIAVKQVEIPRTASDKSDTRQVSVVEALKLESETLKDLDHPNIVQYLGFEETPSFLSIFLEYVPGGSIASCLRKHGKFDEEVTKSFTGQILDGLEYLHSKGILHRDLKADNILVETSGICKISDFGISKRTDDVNFAGAYTSMQGTVFWMAPEVINSQKQGYNSKIDIWSVGCVVFEMWTGVRPWNGQEAMAVLLHLYQTKQGPPVPSDCILSALADDFRGQCFAMDPDERPSAAELRRHQYLTLQPDWVFNGFK